MKKKLELKEITWYRILTGILLLIILVMALKMNPKIDLVIDNGNLLDIFSDETDCFDISSLDFRCEYTNNGDMIPIIQNGTKYARCVVEDKILYEVEVC